MRRKETDKEKGRGGGSRMGERGKEDRKRRKMKRGGEIGKTWRM